MDPFNYDTITGNSADGRDGLTRDYVDISVGGPIDVSINHPSCVGWIGSRPIAKIEYTGPTNRRFNIWTEGALDTTLIVVDPAGTWHCLDDYVGPGGATGHNPQILLPTSLQGTWTIWVGTFAGGVGTTTLSVWSADPL